ncbi:MAG TPA: HAD-IA family hydrolase [Myxococcales bacterium]|jgi:2-phosphoglycolate phosphatase|nr:HAD-IA family hydrolase [Myxococcales bacterium]
MLRLVAYDLDGTLIDSRADLADAVNAMLTRMGLPTHDQGVVMGFVGEGAERLIRRSLGPMHEERYEEAAPIWREEYGACLLKKTKLYDGIAELLQKAPELRAVLTNKPGGFAREICRGLNISDKFVQIVGGDERPRKPSPEGLLRLCREVAVDPEDALLVGDSSVDVATGKAAGVRTCGVTWGIGERAALTSADYLCDTPAQVAGLLAVLST